MKVDGSIWKRNGIDFLREKTKHRDKIISIFRQLYTDRLEEWREYVRLERQKGRDRRYEVCLLFLNSVEISLFKRSNLDCQQPSHDPSFLGYYL